MPSSPLISFVLAAHDTRKSLEPCLQSLLGQSFQDFEIVLVADASPECPVDLIEDFARADRRITVVRLNEIASIGRIRNAGIAKATGRYLGFLDTDHIVWGGAVQAMADRLTSTPGLKILLFDHNRLHLGKSWPGAASEVLARQGRAPFRITNQPELFGTAAHCWDKLFRREFWIEQGLSFPDGLHEEIPVVHRAMLTAGSAAVLQWDCVQIRRRHTQHPAGSPGGTQFDVFERYEESFGMLGDDVRAAIAPHLFTRMIRHYLFLLSLADCVPADDRQAFFQKASEHYQRYQPEGYERPKGKEGVRFQLVANGAYGAFQGAKLPMLVRGVLGRS
ncbi:glycosyltransferase family 2 protein [Streptacidiphilus fuscans]|uniref:Glycosyltransferase n=1 Tax=Streptacidiphilus fuscans TaxID=2789292 RepID=A0A931BGJ0_9ACTN|nr:glycosyltransferase [Streptacidiphilus fuscans]MBF9073748.1 glycosyltransferase [Streptacidiphilus fuscans]